MITDIVITIESMEFPALAYHHVDSETGTVERVYGLLVNGDICLAGLLFADKNFHDKVRDIVQECFDEECAKARLRKLNGEDI